MKVKLLTGMAGAESKAPGDIHECDAEEAARLIEAGFAVPETGDAAETTAKKQPARETRGGKAK